MNDAEIFVTGKIGKGLFTPTSNDMINQSLEKTSFDFSSIFRAMQSYAMNAESRIIPKLPKCMVT